MEISHNHRSMASTESAEQGTLDIYYAVSLKTVPTLPGLSLHRTIPHMIEKKRPGMNLATITAVANATPIRRRLEEQLGFPSCPETTLLQHF